MSLNAFESEHVESQGNIDSAAIFRWGLGAVEHVGMAEGRSEWVVRAAQGASARGNGVYKYPLLPCCPAGARSGAQCKSQMLWHGWGQFSCVEQWTEFTAVVFQPNLCAWGSVARCCHVLQLCAGSISEPCDNFNLGIKKGLYWGLGMPAASFRSACVGDCSPSFAKKLSFLTDFF